MGCYKNNKHTEFEAWILRAVPEALFEETMRSCKENGIVSVNDLAAIREAGLPFAPTLFGFRAAAGIELAIRKESQAHDSDQLHVEKETSESTTESSQRDRNMNPTVSYGKSRMGSSLSWRTSTRLRPNDSEEGKQEFEEALAGDVSSCVTGQIEAIGLIAALLSTWGVSVYVGNPPPDGGLCFGSTGVKASLVSFWVCLGFFFVSVCSTLVILDDLEGVPTALFLNHVHSPVVSFCYQIPILCIAGGIIFLTTGYVIDVGERAGCEFFYFGMVAAAGFIGFVLLIIKWLRYDRGRLNKNLPPSYRSLGSAWIAPWRDRTRVVACETEEFG